jgi:hypothetical protein
LTADWKFQALDDNADLRNLITAAADDKSWATRSIGIWNTKDTGGKGRGLFRKTFTVPEQWNNGRVSLWMTSWWNTSFVERGRVWLDGQEVKGLSSDPYIAIGLASLKPGTSHTLAVEAQSAGVLAGLRGSTWISYEPNPQAKIDLASQWEPSVDGLRYGAPITLPGSYNAQMLRRKVVIDAKHRGQNAFLTVDGSRELVSVLINGRLVRRHHHMIGDRWSLNLTPFIRWGQENEIELVRWESSGSGTVREISLGFHDPKVYS